MKKNIRLEEIVRQYPQTVELFNDLSIDYCCNGKDTLEEAANKKNYDADSLISLIEKEIKKENKNIKENIDFELFEKFSIEEMINSLMNTHHKDERELMEKIEDDLNKILVVHYKNHKDLLFKVHKKFGLLKIELEEHFAKEEKEIFPQMLDTKSFVDVGELEDEHEVAGDIIKEITSFTDNFTLPKDACPTFERTYKQLKELFEDIFIHIYKENSILFKKYRRENK